MRLLVEIEEYVSPTCRINDSYILNDTLLSFAEFRRAERDALQVTQSEYVAFTRSALKVFGQFRKGMLGAGDEVDIDGPDAIRYHFSVLEDAGKRTGAPWNNAYAFGPWDALTSEDPFNRGGGWPNRVQESKPLPIGVGHDPYGNEWQAANEMSDEEAEYWENEYKGR